jgi:hypothetical protein
MSEGKKYIIIASLITVEELKKLATSVPDSIPGNTLLTLTFDGRRIYLKNAEDLIITSINWNNPLRSNSCFIHFT